MREQFKLTKELGDSIMVEASNAYFKLIEDEFSEFGGGDDIYFKAVVQRTTDGKFFGFGYWFYLPEYDLIYDDYMEEVIPYQETVTKYL